MIGGAALVLLFGARETTKDVDAYFLSPKAETMRAAIARAAERLDLPEDWMNDAAKGFFVGVTTGEVLFESEFLIARAASTVQLLAMKLAAWRDAIDRDDARLLLSRLAGSMENIWELVKPFVPAATTGQGVVRVSRSLGGRSWSSLISFALSFQEIYWRRGSGLRMPIGRTFIGRHVTARQGSTAAR